MILDASIVGTRHELNITYQTAQETLYTAVTTLATAEDTATATFSYTVQTADLPTFDGVPVAARFLPYIYMGGANTDASNNRTLCYRVKLNGVSVATSTSITCTANLKWTLNLILTGLNNVVAGDVIDVYLWQVTASALNWSFKGMSIIVSRLFIVNNNKQYLHNTKLSFEVLTSGLFSSGTPYYANTALDYIWQDFYDGTAYARTTISHYPSWGNPYVCYTVKRQHETYGLYRFAKGDSANGEVIACHATYMPYWSTPNRIKNVYWHPTRLGA